MKDSIYCFLSSSFFLLNICQLNPPVFSLSVCVFFNITYWGKLFAKLHLQYLRIIHPLSRLLFFSYLVLTYPILSYPILTCPILSYPLQSTSSNLPSFIKRSQSQSPAIASCFGQWPRLMASPHWSWYSCSQSGTARGWRLGVGWELAT